MARRTRRPSVVWLPNRPGPPGGSLTNDGNSLIFQHDVAGALGERVTTIHPLTFDLPAETNLAAINAFDPSLSDFEGSAYRLRRIVGKIFVAMEQTSDDENRPDTFYITCGFIILRVDPFTGDAIGGANPDPNYTPQAVGSERDPWIWRRSWILGNSEAATSFAEAYPGSSAGYGSVADGPHIDAKTARRVSDEERLFFVASTSVFSALGNGQISTAARYLLDYRILASMLKQAGNRRNASR